MNIIFYPTEWREYDSDILTETKKKASYNRILVHSSNLYNSPTFCLWATRSQCSISSGRECERRREACFLMMGKEHWSLKYICIWGFNIEHFFSTSFCSILPPSPPFFTHHPRRIAINYIIKKTYQTFSGKTEQNYINMLVNRSCAEKTWF